MNKAEATQHIRQVRRELDTLWRCARDLAEDEPQYLRADNCTQVETAVFEAHQRLHALEDFLDEASA